MPSPARSPARVQGRTSAWGAESSGGDGNRKSKHKIALSDDENCSSPHTPASAAMEEAIRKRNESLAKAVAKAEAAKKAAAERQQELRVGEEWSEKFMIPKNRRDPELLVEFWEVVRVRLLKKFGSLHTAVRSVQSSVDGGVTFLKFCDLLKGVHLPLPQSVSRAMFDKVTEGRREMSADALKSMLMERTIQAMRFVMNSWNGKQARVKSHIRHFLRRLSEAGQTMTNYAVDRFQRKLTKEFLRSFWQALQRRSTASKAEDTAITRSDLMSMLLDPSEKTNLLANEIRYMLRILTCVASHTFGTASATSVSVPVNKFITGLTLLSSILDEEKISVIFNAFDSDFDSCLLYEQIHEMCLSICVLRPMVEESARGAEDETFQSELSQQEGQHCYECIRWHLQRSGNVQGDIASFPELWATLKAQPAVLKALLPGLTRIRWVAKVLPGDDTEEFAQDAERTVLLAAAGKSEESKGKRQTAKGASIPKLSRQQMRGLPGAGGMSRMPRSLPLQADKGNNESILDPHLDLGMPRKEGKSEALFFKTFRMKKFAKSLRSLGDNRLTELTRTLSSKDLGIQDLGEGWPETPPAVSTPSPRPGSAADGQKGRAGRLTSLGRASSAPTVGLLPGSPLGTLTSGLGATSPGSKDIAGLHSSETHILGFVPQRWGGESSGRFKIFASGQAGEDQATLRRGKPDPLSIQNFVCKLCFCSHSLCPGHDGGAIR
eukprot:TRINITY_DN90880_c0_g1_i1.p1 TRINITY_DN90880_c0_g1~~TRINITY_DN90880_c0_g1_i1.p1  ORF type:complete len:720 (+),score=137.76 TRINITY_DN90880_c0_g1_i1:82-2241(+)